MKRAAVYLTGTIAVVIILITAQLSGVPNFDSASWEPDDGGTQGYIVEWYADSLLTASAPGRPLRLITPDTIYEALKAYDDEVEPDAPVLNSGSSLLDAAWRLAISRLHATHPTPYNILVAPLSAVNKGNAQDAAWSLIKNVSVNYRNWPLADVERLMSVIALGKLANVSVEQRWLSNAIKIASVALATDSMRLFRPNCGLWAGGGDNDFSGALPEWMTPSDRFQTVSLAVNTLVADSYGALASMKQRAGISDPWELGAAHDIAQSINDRLWLPVEGYYCQYLYGRLQLVQGPATSGMGNAAAASSPIISTEEMARRVVKGLPRTPYGIARSFPLPYGSSSVAVPITDQGVWALACKRAGNERALWSALSVLLRAVGLVAVGDDPDVPEVWGAYVGAITGILFGLEPTPGGLAVNPVVPTELSGDKTLEGIRYLDAILDVTVAGTGTKAASVMLDGEVLPDFIVPPDISGHHSLRIEMINSQPGEQQAIPVTLPSTLYPTPALSWVSPTEARDTFPFSSELDMARYRNGVSFDNIPAGKSITIPATGGYSEWVIQPVGETGRPVSMMSEPHPVIARGAPVVFQAEWFKARELARDVYRRMFRRWRKLKARKRPDELPKPNPRLTQIVELKSTDELTFTAEVPIAADCVLIFGYADGLDAGNPGMPLRSVSVNGTRLTSIVMPRHGTPADSTVTLQTSPVKAHLTSGLNSITLSSTNADRNPNSTTDTVMIDYLRIIPLD